MVSDRDREYLRRLGELQDEEHAAAVEAHLALSLDERLARSVSLMQRFLGSVSPSADDPTPFYERARRLGLYRP